MPTSCIHYHFEPTFSGSKHGSANTAFLKKKTCKKSILLWTIPN